MKKIISIILSATMLLTTAAITANAAAVSTDEFSGQQYRYEELSKTTLPDNTLKTYTYGLTEANNPATNVLFCTDPNDVNQIQAMYLLTSTNCLKGVQTIKVQKGNYTGIICDNGLIRSTYNFDNTGGEYVLTKFKLSDFDDYFNDDGTFTYNYSDDYSHKFNSTDEHNGNKSQLVILSGGYVNFVVPDENGYVQAYICKDLGVHSYFVTHFEFDNGFKGGSKVRLYALVKGNVNLKGDINVDDVTAVQKYSAELEEFNKLQKRNADVTGDGKVDIDDATMIQKYIAGLI